MLGCFGPMVLMVFSEPQIGLSSQFTVLHTLGAGAYAGCSYCMHTGEYSKILRKVIYPGNRHILPEGDSLRYDNVNFPDKSKDKSSPPDAKAMKFVDDANTAYASLAQENGCKGLRKTSFT